MMRGKEKAIDKLSMVFRETKRIASFVYQYIAVSKHQRNGLLQFVCPHDKGNRRLPFRLEMKIKLRYACIGDTKQVKTSSSLLQDA